MHYTEKDLTFVVCAFGENPYLEECIQSVKNQTIQPNIIMTTSTPNEFVKDLSEKYQIPLIINSSGKHGIVEDWNFGYQSGKSKFVTICHQDDTYCEQYAEELLKMCNTRKNILIFFTDYYELRNNEKVYHNKLLKIKRLLLFPLRLPFFAGNKWIRKRILSFGSPICCPAVSFNKEQLTIPIFTNKYKSVLDWDAWERISRKNGNFAYCPKPLMCHRIHEESLTSKVIANHIRDTEDLEMFEKFWPKGIAHIIWSLYKKSGNSNSI